MKTIVKNWFIVSVMDHDKRLGNVIYGYIVSDESFRFNTGEYVCTSKLVDIQPELNLAKTASGSLYQLLGKGRKAIIDFDDFELLRNGFSPIQIKALNQTSPKVAH